MKRKVVIGNLCAAQKVCTHRKDEKLHIPIFFFLGCFPNNFWNETAVPFSSCPYCLFIWLVPNEIFCVLFGLSVYEFMPSSVEAQRVGYIFIDLSQNVRRHG